MQRWRKEGGSLENGSNGQREVGMTDGKKEGKEDNGRLKERCIAEGTSWYVTGKTSTNLTGQGLG